MDELDALIDQAVAAEGPPAAAGAEPVADSPASESISETAIPETPAPATEPVTQEPEAPTEPSDAETSPTEPPVETTDPALVEALQRQLGATQYQLNQFIAQAQQAQEAARMAKLREEWEALPPEDAARAQAEFVIEEAVRRVEAAEARVREMEETQRRVAQAEEDAQAKPKAIQRIADHFGLPKEERYLLEGLMDPMSMAAVAKARAEQLATVKDTRREAALENPALTTGVTGNGAIARSAPAEFSDLDTLLDHVLGTTLPQ